MFCAFAGEANLQICGIKGEKDRRIALSADPTD
jgi:hypothetical protein